MQVSAVCRFDLRDAWCSVMGDRIHQVVITAHRNELTGGQVIERQVDGATAAVTRLGGDVAVREHLRPVDVRVVAELRPAVLRLLCPAQEAIDGALRRLASARANIIGAVLVKFNARTADPSYSYLADYYGYSAEEDEAPTAGLIASSNDS